MAARLYKHQPKTILSLILSWTDIVQLRLQRERQLRIRRDDLTQLQLQRNADYKFGESEDSDDELEFNSDASVSKDNEVEDEEEVLVKEELVEVDAKI